MAVELAVSGGWSDTLAQTEIFQFCVDIHGPQRVKPADLTDFFSFHLEPAAGPNVH